jgi:hypothetical protein
MAMCSDFLTFVNNKYLFIKCGCLNYGKQNKFYFTMVVRSCLGFRSYFLCLLVALKGKFICESGHIFVFAILYVTETCLAEVRHQTSISAREQWNLFADNGNFFGTRLSVHHFSFCHGYWPQDTGRTWTMLLHRKKTQNCPCGYREYIWELEV